MDLKTKLSSKTLDYINEKIKNNDELVENIEDNFGLCSDDMRNSYFDIKEIEEKLYSEKCDSCKLKHRNLKYIVSIGENKYYVGTHCILRYEFIKDVFVILKNDNITLKQLNFHLKMFNKTTRRIERKSNLFYNYDSDN